MYPNSRQKKGANMLATTAMHANYAAMIVAGFAVKTRKPADAKIQINPDPTAPRKRFSIAPGVVMMIT